MYDDVTLCIMKGEVACEHDVVDDGQGPDVHCRRAVLVEVWLVHGLAVLVGGGFHLV